YRPGQAAAVRRGRRAGRRRMAGARAGRPVGAAAAERIPGCGRAADRAPGAGKTVAVFRRGGRRGAFGGAGAPGRARHSRRRQPGCRALSPRHGRRVPEADRRSRHHRAGAPRRTLSMDPAARVDEWLRRLAAERAPSPHTLAAYRRDLAKLTTWMQAQGIDDFAALTPDHMRGFVAKIHRNGLAPSSLQRLLSAWRSLFAWLLAEGHIEHDPAAGVRGPRTRRKLPQVLDTDEATRLVATPTDEDALGVRDRAMLELFYSSGLRLSELTGLRWRDLDLDEGMVRVLGKGSRTRIVPVGRHAVAAL